MRLTAETASRIAACFADLSKNAQRSDSRKFAARWGDEIRQQLAANRSPVVLDWDAEDQGDAAYLIGCRASYGLRETAAKMDTGKRRIGTTLVVADE